MTSSLITLLVGVGLSLIAIVSTPLAARVTYRQPDPDTGYFSTTIMALLITAAYGGGAISMIIWVSDFGAPATWIMIPAYLIAMAVLGRLVWKLIGPHAAPRATRMSIHPVGA
ncbi:MAG: hypothetical protein NXI18_18650 [Alphaproteobacteria bacterium]|nr:hypothetical protein [Alphaproteobacteria bacterium]